MLNQLVFERYNKSSADDRKAFVEEAERMISRYGWQDRTVMPWASCSIKVTKIIDDLKDFDSFTEDSKHEIVILVNGLAEIMNAWEKHEREEKVSVRCVKSGKVRQMSKDFALIMASDGIVEII